MNNCRVYRGAQLDNINHWLLIISVGIKLKVDHSARPETWLDRSHLQDPHIQATYSCSIVNSFNAILGGNDDDLQHFKDAITGAAKEALED